MRITELFNIQSIALDSAAADQAQIIDELVELQATHGNLTDKAAYKAAIYAREYRSCSVCRSNCAYWNCTYGSQQS